MHDKRPSAHLVVSQRLADVLEHPEHRHERQEEQDEGKAGQKARHLAHTVPEPPAAAHQPNERTPHDSISFTRACTIE